MSEVTLESRNSATQNGSLKHL